MLSNYLSAALRNFSRNRAYSIIVTLSLAIGFAAMMLAAIYWRYEHSFDRFWPNADRIYLAITKTDGVNGPRGPALWGGAPESIGPFLVQSVAGVEEVTRLREEFLQLKTDRADAPARGVSADSNFFRFFPPRLIAGDLSLRPGAVVLTRSTAEKYYGRTDVIGQSLTVGRLGASTTRAVQISAVIEDWPADSHLKTDYLLGEGLAGNRPGDALATTYLRVRQGVSEQSLRTAFERLARTIPPTRISRKEYRRQLFPLPLHFAYMPPKEFGRTSHGPKHAPIGLPEVFLGLGALMLVVSAINFINLMTARGAGRAVEVGVRKVVGAKKRDLIVQFVGEDLLYAGFAFVLALALVEIMRPLLTSMTGQPLPFEYGKSVGLLAILALGAVVVGIVASFYPALVLSRIRPMRAIRNDFTALAGSRRLRQWLVVLQFVPLLILAGGALGFQGQERTLLNNSMKLVPANGLVVREPCTVALKAQLAAIPGVSSVACLEMGSFYTSQGFNGVSRDIGSFTSIDILRPSGKSFGADVQRTDREGLAYYDTEVVAGKLWSNTEDQRGLILNEAAVKSLGYDPKLAVGQQATLRQVETKETSLHPIIGVIRDRAETANRPTGYLQAEAGAERQNLVAGLRLDDKADRVATTAAIDKMFKASTGRLPQRAFDRDELLESRLEERRIMQWLAAIVAVGLAMAAAGIFAMAVFLANLRTREIGIRKAFGASRFNLVRILIFQFLKPVLIANLIAGPLVVLAANATARKTPVDERLILTLSAYAPVLIGSIAITILATFSQAWRVTGKLPLKALRSE